MAVWASSMIYADDAYPLRGSLNSLRAAIGDESFRRLMHSEVQLEMARAGVFSSQGVMPVTARTVEQPRSWMQDWTGSSPKRRVIPWAQPVDINGDGCISPSEVALAESERRLELARAGLPLRGQDADMQWASQAGCPMAQEMQSLRDWSAFSPPAALEGVRGSWSPPVAWPVGSAPLAADVGRYPRSSSTPRRRPNPPDIDAMPIGCPKDINQDGIIDGSEVALAMSEERLRRVRAGLSPGFPPTGWSDGLCSSSLPRPSPSYPFDAYCSTDVIRARTAPAFEQWHADKSWNGRPTYASRVPGQNYDQRRVEFAEQAPFLQDSPRWSSALPVDINGDGIIDSREAALADSERRLKQVQAESAFLASKSAAAICSRPTWLPLLR